MRRFRPATAGRYALLLLLATATVGAQDDPARGPRPNAFDEILDLYVRDGFVYYRALKLERGRFDGVVAQLAGAQVGSFSRDEQVAFWLNAYNALVLRTVIDHYPIDGKSSLYPANSIRQIPGAFESARHTVAGRSLTLDEIEKTILPEFHDPRVYFALGRGAVASGRLRSEGYAADRLEAQLTGVAGECARRLECVQIDRGGNQVLASSIFSWRDREFAAAYAGAASSRFNDRTPVERAILAYVEPRLFGLEQEFLARNAFDVKFLPFDWSLNDLTGRGGR
jgi:Protein of unknown function, DUF547